MEDTGTQYKDMWFGWLPLYVEAFETQRLGKRVTRYRIRTANGEWVSNWSQTTQGAAILRAKRLAERSRLHRVEPRGEPILIDTYHVNDSKLTTLELYNAGKDHAFIEWTTNGDFVANIGLWFDITWQGKRTLVDYDGVVTLPERAMLLLERNGVDCDDMRKSLND